MLQPINKYFAKICNSFHIPVWKSKGLSDETIKPPPATSANGLVPSLNNIGVRPRILFDGQWLKQGKVKFAYKNVMNSYIACEIDLWSYTQCVGFTLKNFLFWAV